MNWLLQIHATHAVAHAIGILALVCLAEMALGSVKVRGIGLGTTGVLFAGTLTGYFSKPVDHATLEFVKEFGLVLFIFTGARVCFEYQPLGCSDGLLHHGVSADHVATHPVGPDPRPGLMRMMRCPKVL